MGSNSLHFCVDIDNVLACTDEVMRGLISHFSRGRVCLSYDDIVVFDYYQCRDKQGNEITKEDWKQVHELFSETENLINIKPMPGAIEGLQRLAELGTIHLATSRLRKARRGTVEWLEKHGFPEHDLHFLRHGEKHTALKQLTVAVEDDYDQAVAYATLGETPCFLIKHPWNRAGAPVEGVQWVDDWRELTSRLIAFV